MKAKIVVVAAGSIHTPAVLLRSKFKSNLIGKYLTLHPVLGAGCNIPKVCDNYHDSSLVKSAISM